MSKKGSKYKAIPKYKNSSRDGSKAKKIMYLCTCIRKGQTLTKDQISKEVHV